MKLICAVAAVVAVLGQPARADDRKAELEMQKARQAMDRREYDAAIGHFLVARALAPSSTGPYLGLGLAYAAVGRCDDAVPFLEEYLRRKTADPYRGAEVTLAVCKARMQSPPPVERRAPPPERPPPPQPPSPSPPPPEPSQLPPPSVPSGPGTLVVKIEPLEATVSINNAVVATATRKLEKVVEAGFYQVGVARDGYQPESRYLWVRSGETAYETFTLVDNAPIARHHKLNVALGVTIPLVVLGAVGAIIGVYAPRPGEESRFSVGTAR
jgi:hypothetical protein